MNNVERTEKILAIAEERKFVVEWIGTTKVCYRYNSHNPKIFDDIEVFFETWGKEQ